MDPKDYSYNKKSEKDKASGRPDFIFHLEKEYLRRWPQWPFKCHLARLFAEVKYVKLKRGRLDMDKSEENRLFGQIVDNFECAANSPAGPMYAGLLLILVDANADKRDMQKLYERLRKITLQIEAAAKVSSPKCARVNLALSVAKVGPGEEGLYHISSMDDSGLSL